MSQLESLRHRIVGKDQPAFGGRAPEFTAIGMGARYRVIRHG